MPVAYLLLGLVIPDRRPGIEGHADAGFNVAIALVEHRVYLATAGVWLALGGSP